MTSNNTPYTYLIGWSIINKYYYGVRFKNNCHPSEFWSKYFTSSKYVLALKKELGDPDIIQIRKTFNSVSKAIKWEKKVLSRLKIFHSEKWLNKNIAGAIKPQIGQENPMYGKSRTGEKHKGAINISNGLKKFYASEEGQKKKELMSKNFAGENNVMYGKKHKPEFVEKMKKLMSGTGNPMYGKSHSEEIKQKLRKTFIVNKTIVVKNAKEWCKENNYYYGNFLRAASTKKPYRGLTIEYFSQIARQ